MKNLISVLLILAAGAPAYGAARCVCVANGQRVEEGRIACIRPQSGTPYLARCDKVLNNTSWTRLQDGCPSAGAGRNLSVQASATFVR